MHVRRVIGIMAISAVLLMTPAAFAADTGTLTGTVTVAGPAPQRKPLPVFKHGEVCGAAVPDERLVVGPGGGLRYAVVTVEGVKDAKPAERDLTHVLDNRECRFVPHVQTAEVGQWLEITNSDPILHNVHARQATADGLQTVFNIAQPVRGQRTKVDAPLDKPGIVALTCEAGHPWMTAYILVANHPFVATSDDRGEFVIDDVPPGTYPIKMWHEGVQLSRVIPSLQIFEYEEPYEANEQVVVPARGEVVVNFSFQLRSKASGASSN